MDFFAGSGVSTRVAIEEGRHSLSCDIDNKLKEFTNQQIEKIDIDDPHHPVIDYALTEYLGNDHPVFR